MQTGMKAMEDLPLETDTARFPSTSVQKYLKDLDPLLGLTPILPWHELEKLEPSLW